MTPGLPSGSVVLRARWLIPRAGTVIDGGWLRIERGRVSEIGRGTPPARAGDLGDVVVVPGLVNAHTHLEFSLLDEPLPGDGGLPGWIARLVALRRAEGGDPTARARAIAAGLAESLAAGVTALGEIATAPVPEGLPVAAPRLRVYRECLGLAPAALDRAAALEQQGFAPTPRRLPGLSPHAPYSVAAPLGRRLVALARRHRLPVAMHLAESDEEAALLDGGSGPFRTLLESLGAWPTAPPELLPVADWITLLARAPRGLVVHATFVAPGSAALDRLARHRDRLAVAVCPRTARRLTGRVPPVAALRSAGIRVALGTDGRGSSPDLDPRGEGRALIDAGVVSPREALGMATVDAAFGIGLERVAGHLAPGRPADLAVIATGPTSDAYAAAFDPAAPIAATLVAGRLVYGRLPA